MTIKDREAQNKLCWRRIHELTSLIDDATGEMKLQSLIAENLIQIAESRREEFASDKTKSPQTRGFLFDKETLLWVEVSIPFPGF